MDSKKLTDLQLAQLMAIAQSNTAIKPQIRHSKTYAAKQVARAKTKRANPKSRATKIYVDGAAQPATNHTRLVALRAHRMGITVEEYRARFCH